MSAPFDREDFPDEASYQAAIEAFWRATYRPPQTPEEHIRAQDCLVDAVACCMDAPEFTREALVAQCVEWWPEGGKDAEALIQAAVDRALADKRLKVRRRDGHLVLG